MRTLHRYALLTAAATFLLLIAGSLVTSTGSGLAVPDWPLSYGTWFPPMVGDIAYEHGHRLIAGAVGMMILVLAVWIARAGSPRWLRRLGYVALGTVIVQALLGGLTVLLLLPPQMSIAHACLGQAVWCLVVSAAYGIARPSALSQAGRPGTRAAAAKKLSRMVMILAILQVALGAVVRHTGYAVMPHLIVAFVFLLHVGLLLRRIVADPGTGLLRPQALCLLGLVGAQIALGFLVFFHRGLLLARTGHVALGALILAQGVILTWETHRVARLS